jgi:hypothetical protein
LLPEEQRILDLKYRSLPFGRLSEMGLRTTTKVLMLKISVITGWIVPDKELKIILEDQLSKMFVESFPTVNADEMEFAFRNNHVKDWGKSMNLNLINEVMEPYLERRREVSKFEEQRREGQLLLPENTVTDQEFVESVKMLYQHHQDFKQIPVLVYDCIDQELTSEKKKEIKAIVDGIMEGATKDHYKQYAVKLYFDGLVG